MHNHSPRPRLSSKSAEFRAEYCVPSANFRARANRPLPVLSAGRYFHSFSCLRGTDRFPNEPPNSSFITTRYTILQRSFRNWNAGEPSGNCCLGPSTGAPRARPVAMVDWVWRARGGELRPPLRRSRGITFGKIMRSYVYAGSCNPVHFLPENGGSQCRP